MNIYTNTGDEIIRILLKTKTILYFVDIYCKTEKIF